MSILAEIDLGGDPIEAVVETGPAGPPSGLGPVSRTAAVGTAATEIAADVPAGAVMTVTFRAAGQTVRSVTLPVSALAAEVPIALGTTPASSVHLSMAGTSLQCRRDAAAPAVEAWVWRHGAVDGNIDPSIRYVVGETFNGGVYTLVVDTPFPPIRPGDAIFWRPLNVSTDSALVQIEIDGAGTRHVFFADGQFARLSDLKAGDMYLALASSPYWILFPRHIRESSQSDAESGTSGVDGDLSRMTPRRTKQAIDKQVPPLIEDARVQEFIDDPQTAAVLSGYTNIDPSLGESYFTGANGQAIATEGTGDPAPLYFAIAYRDSAGVSRRDELDLSAGDEFLVHEVSGGNFLFGTVKTQAARNDAQNSPIAWSWEYTLDTGRGLDAYGALPAGAIRIHIRKSLDRSFVRRDGSNVTDELRDAVLGEAIDEELGVFTRVAAGLASGGDNRFSSAGTLTLSVAADANYQSDTAVTNDAKLWRAAKERAWIRFGNGYEIEIVSLSARYLSEGRAQYQLDDYDVLSGAVVGLNSQTSVTVIGEHVDRGQLTQVAFRERAAGAAHRYARTDGAGDAVYESPDTAPTSASKKLVTSGGVRTEFDKRPRHLVATDAEVSFASGVYTVTPATALDAYDKGVILTFEAPAANTGAADVNVSTLGNKDVVREDGSQLEAGDIPSGHYAVCVYDGSFFVLQNRHRAAAMKKTLFSGSMSLSKQWSSVDLGAAELWSDYDILAVSLKETSDREDTTTVWVDTTRIAALDNTALTSENWYGSAEEPYILPCTNDMAGGKIIIGRRPSNRYLGLSHDASSAVTYEVTVRGFSFP